LSGLLIVIPNGMLIIGDFTQISCESLTNNGVSVAYNWQKATQWHLTIK
jgi:hypothetical protein